MRNEVLVTQRSLQVRPSKCPSIHRDRYVTAPTLPATSTLFIGHYRQMKRIFVGWPAKRPARTLRQSVIGNYRSINVRRRRLIDGTAQHRAAICGAIIRGVGSSTANLPQSSSSDSLSLHRTTHRQ